MRVLVGGAAAAAAVLLYAVVLRQRRRAARVVAPPPLPRAIIISLARRSAKRGSVLARVAEAGLGSVAEIFEAVDGRVLTAESLAARGVALYSGWCQSRSTNRFHSRELKAGEVGCALSHHGVWSLAAAHGAPVLVLEDDVAFVPDFAAHLLAAMREAEALAAAGLGPPPDLLYVARRPMLPDAARLPRGPATAGGDGAAPGLAIPGFSYKTTAYVLWPSGAAKLLSSGYLQRLVPVDDLLPCLYARHALPGHERPDLDELFSAAPRLNALATRPNLAWERRGVSDTENSDSVSGTR